MRKLTPESIELVNQEIRNYLNLSDTLTLTPRDTDQWFVTLRKCQATYHLLKTLTGLPERRLDELIYNKTNTSSYWLANGDIRKDHP